MPTIFEIISHYFKVNAKEKEKMLRRCNGHIKLAIQEDEYRVGEKLNEDERLLYVIYIEAQKLLKKQNRRPKKKMTMLEQIRAAEKRQNSTREKIRQDHIIQLAAKASALHELLLAKLYENRTELLQNGNFDVRKGGVIVKWESNFVGTSLHRTHEENLYPRS